MKPSIRRVLILGMVASAGLIWGWHGPGRRDFFSFYASGEAVLKGANPYDLAIDPTLTPPFTLPLLSLLPRLEPWTAYVAWWIVSLALYLLVLAVLLRAYPARRTPVFLGWTLAYMPLSQTLYNGQIYVVLLMLTAAAWLAVQRQRPLVAGVALGLLIATKPNFALWPALLFLAGLRLLPLVAFGVAGVLTLAPLLWYGPDVLLAWLNAGAVDAILKTGAPGELSLRGIGTRFGTPEIGVVFAAGLTLSLLWWAWSDRPDAASASRQGLIGSILVAPLMWPGYAIVLLPVFFHERWTPLVRASALLLTLPYVLVTVQIGGRLSPWLASLFGVAGLLLLLSAPPFAPLVRRLSRLSAPGRTAALTAGKR